MVSMPFTVSSRFAEVRDRLRYLFLNVLTSSVFKNTKNISGLMIEVGRNSVNRARQALQISLKSVLFNSFIFSNNSKIS